jgi:DNA-binding IclR family transcriptional regulator
MARPSPQTDRVVALVGLLTSSPDATITLADATRRLRVNKSTCHSMLTALTEHAWLLRDPIRKTYRLGPALVAVARIAAQGFPLLELAHPVMTDVSLEIGANCAAIAVGPDHVEVLDQIRDLRAAGEGLRIGACIPLRPPFGAAAIAMSPPETVAHWLTQAPADTHDHYRSALDAIRARGYTVEAATSTATSHIEDLRTLAGDLTDEQRDHALFDPELLSRIARDLAVSDDYLVTDIQPDRMYTVVTITAPVVDATGAVPLLLCLWGFPSRIPGTEVDRIGHRLVTATTNLSATLPTTV